MKGIILAGGSGTRLKPLTDVVCKQLLPVYNKPLIYYPLSVLMLLDIRDILVISTPYACVDFVNLLGSGNDLGLNITFTVQDEPKGIAEAFILGESFIDYDDTCLILGDNIFYGGDMVQLMLDAWNKNKKAVAFSYWVPDPERFGVVNYDNTGSVVSIEEKPQVATSNWIITGLYMYNNSVTEYVKKLKPSHRNELEITDLNKMYLRENGLHVEKLGRGTIWFDVGTTDSLFDASAYVKLVESKQGINIACLEEIAVLKGYITEKEAIKLCKNNYNTEYYQRFIKSLSRYV